MPWAVARSLGARLLREQAERDAARRAAEQARAFRSWFTGAKTLASRLVQETGRTPGGLNPLGQTYQRAGMDNPSMRPSRPRSVLRSLAEAFAPSNVFEAQRAAFQGELPGAREAREFGG